MVIKKLALVAAMLTMAAFAPSAHAEEPTVTGYNNGDSGFIGLTWGNPLAQTRDSLNDGTVDARCEFHQQQAPGSNWALLTVEGHAKAALKGDQPAVSVGIECFLYDSQTNVLVFTDAESTAGTAAVWLPPRTTVVPIPHPYKICIKTKVSWRDFTETFNLNMKCYAPSLVPVPPI